VVLPDACITLHYMLVRMRTLIEGLVVDRERMRLNLQATHGLVYSQGVLLALVEAGMTRDSAYRIIQENAMKAWDTGDQLLDLLAADERVILDRRRLQTCFDPRSYLGNTAVIWERLENLQLAPA
jgi:adenylosuccinate lyase